MNKKTLEESVEFLEHKLKHIIGLANVIDNAIQAYISCDKNHDKESEEKKNDQMQKMRCSALLLYS